jgi:4'-phosphopantetheinyl transferase
LRTDVFVQSGLPPISVAVERAAEAGRDEHRRGRLLLRRLVREVLTRDEVEIAVTDRGAPWLVGHRAGVSISHTSRYTAAALWPAGPVGVDVEEAPDALDARLVRRCCGPWHGYVNDLPPSQRSAAFVRVWTVQEACVKALGLGLAGAPWRIPVPPLAVRGRWREVVWMAQRCAAPAALAVAVDLSRKVSTGELT